MTQLNPTIDLSTGNDANILLTVYADVAHSSRYNLTGASLIFTVKRQETDTANVLQKTTSDGITITDATQGEATITIEDTDTTDFSQRAYVFDVQVTDSSAEVFTVTKDYINFITKIT